MRKNSIWRNLRTANLFYGEISVRRNICTKKFPYGEISYGEISGHESPLVLSKNVLFKRISPMEIFLIEKNFHPSSVLIYVARLTRTSYRRARYVLGTVWRKTKSYITVTYMYLHTRRHFNTFRVFTPSHIHSKSLIPFTFLRISFKRLRTTSHTLPSPLNLILRFAGHAEAVFIHPFMG